MSRYNMKIEVKDSVVKATVYDESGEYVSEVTCDDSDLDSVLKAIKKSARLAEESAETEWPKYSDLYYTPDFATNDLTCVKKWIGWSDDYALKKRNLVFRTREEAMAAAGKMLKAISPQKEDKK